MSRIGRKPITIPEGVDIKINGMLVEVSKGSLKLSQMIRPEIKVSVEGNEILVTRDNDSKVSRSLHGLSRALIYNMVVGVTTGFTKNLEINGIGYRAQKVGNKIVMNLGYSHPVEMVEPEGITFEVPSNTKIIVRGADKQLVGETAAKIRSFRSPDAYKGKGVKYEDETLHLKEGKTGAKS